MIPDGMVWQSLGGLFVEHFLMAVIFFRDWFLLVLVAIGGVDGDTSNEVPILINQPRSMLFSGEESSISHVCRLEDYWEVHLINPSSFPVDPWLDCGEPWISQYGSLSS